MKNYHPSYLFPFEWFINNKLNLTGLDHSEQRRKSILIHGHAQNREPLPLKHNIAFLSQEPRVEVTCMPETVK